MLSTVSFILFNIVLAIILTYLEQIKDTSPVVSHTVHVSHGFSSPQGPSPSPRFCYTILQSCHRCFTTHLYQFCLYAIDSRCFTVVEIAIFLFPHLITG